MHEQSETYGENGQYYLGYGRGTAVPGQRLPNTPTFPSPEAAEPYAVQRSRNTPRSAENPLSVQQAWERAAAGGTRRMPTPTPPGLEGWQKLGPGDLVASGLAKPGPLAGWVQQGADPAQNAQNIREGINPSPQAQKPALGQPGPAQSPLAQAQERFQNPFGKTLGGINIPGLGHPFQPGSAPASMAPGLGGAKLLPGMIGQGVAGAGEALASGRGPLAALKEGATGALGAGALGGLAHLGLGLPAKAAAAKKVMGEFGNVLKGRELTAGVNKEMTGALNTLEKQAFEKARATHAEDAAKKVASELKKNVPALAPFAADSKGLVDMIYGKGKAAVSRAFDKALKEVVANGKGKSVQLAADAADALGVQGTGGGALPLSRVAREALEKAGKLPPQGMVTVDAGELANAALGTWRKDPRSYRAAMDALDKANIGDPAARAAYKHYTGLSQFVDKTGALKGEVFNPDAFNAGMTKLKQVEEMRRRGIGSATEGYGGLARGGPLAPAPRQVPIQGPEPSGPAGITVRKNPFAGHPILGTMVGGAAGSPFGLPGHIAGALAGGGLSQIMPKEIVTQAPGVNPGIQALIDAITRGGGLAGSRLAQ